MCTDYACTLEPLEPVTHHMLGEDKLLCELCERGASVSREARDYLSIRLVDLLVPPYPPWKDDSSIAVSMDVIVAAGGYKIAAVKER